MSPYAAVTIAFLAVMGLLSFSAVVGFALEAFDRHADARDGAGYLAAGRGEQR